MLDIKVIREDPERVRAALRDLNDEETIPRIDLIVELDGRRRALLLQVEEMRGETPVLLHFQNSAGKRITVEANESFNVRRSAELESSLGRWMEE